MQASLQEKNFRFQQYQSLFTAFLADTRPVLQSARSGFSRFCIVRCVFCCSGGDCSLGKITFAWGQFWNRVPLLTDHDSMSADLRRTWLCQLQPASGISNQSTTPTMSRATLRRRRLVRRCAHYDNWPGHLKKNEISFDSFFWDP